MASIKMGAVLATALALLAGGCGDSGGDAPEAAGEPAAESAFPVTVRDATRRVTVERRPERIVSLSPSATETLFAVGAGDQVIAVDDESDWPRGVPTTDLSSYQPNVEAIAGHRPDLVVVPASVPRDVISGLRRLGLTVLAEPAPDVLGDAYHQIRELGIATGHRAAGELVADRTRERVEELIAAAPEGPPLKVFHELDPDLFSASSDTFIGRIYARLGLRNVADQAAERSANPYPQLSSEAVVSADPDLVVLADTECCGQTPAKVGRRAGWDAVAAVRDGAVVAIDDDIASRWGPRVPLFVERVVEAIETARGSEGGGG
ncbi:MAG TPA: ABC transporter substrate-binding protein [Thermoleophilaceae bacterium]|nr:ABC transporter substrate-binding protein [Thermoleophilaceae bacterium]